ncbi:MAG: DUF99 family protein [Candidatus ainarchaeum sp.]|nr:DUF99 family protein [Candidatus ainarchaeum sp.]
MTFKSGARVLGVDDSPFTEKDSRVLVVGVVERQGKVDGVLSTTVERDGDDSTERISSMVRGSRFLPQIRAVLLSSIMMGGFNVVDIARLSGETGLPVVAVVRRKPDMARVLRALSRVRGAGPKRERMEKAGEPVRLAGLYAQVAGIPRSGAEEILGRRKGVPEAVRLAHVIAGGVTRGESSGKA